MTRPVPQKFTLTTSTGTYGPAYFGAGMEWAGIQFNNPSTQSIKGTVQYSLGGSGVWVNVITLSTLNTVGGDVTLHVQSTAVFDKLIVNLTSNTLSATGTSGLPIWLGAY